jgi:hypothetical protein
VEIPWRYGARGKKTNNLHLEIIWINNNIMKPNRCSSSDLKNIFRNASNDLHVLYNNQLQNFRQLETYQKGKCA